MSFAKWPTSVPLSIGFGSSVAIIPLASSPLDGSDLCSGECLRIGFGFIPSFEYFLSFLRMDFNGFSSVSITRGLAKCL